LPASSPATDGDGLSLVGCLLCDVLGGVYDAERECFEREPGFVHEPAPDFFSGEACFLRVIL
jgi:hypothetical protein